jgi:hypothetical protein
VDNRASARHQIGTETLVVSNDALALCVLGTAAGRLLLGL